MAKTIGIVGSRRRNSAEDFTATENALVLLYEEGDRLVSGGCPKGGDRFCEILAKQRNIPLRIHQANWAIGRHAGFERNTLIAQDADVLIAVVAADRTGGTEDTIRKFRKLKPEGKVVLL